MRTGAGLERDGTAEVVKEPAVLEEPAMLTVSFALGADVGMAVGRDGSDAADVVDEAAALATTTGADAGWPEASSLCGDEQPAQA